MDLLAKFDAVLPDLKEKPCATLLLKLCLTTLTTAPQKANLYWKHLEPIAKALPPDERRLVEAYSPLMEARQGGEGFSAKIIEQIHDAFKLNDQEQIKQRLHAIEEQVNKRKWPSGKKHAWFALVDAWEGIERSNVLRLLDKVSEDYRPYILHRLNQTAPLTPEEWQMAKIGQPLLFIMSLLDHAGGEIVLQVPPKILTSFLNRFLPFPFEGWIQNRRLYSPSELLEHYETLVRSQEGRQEAVDLLRDHQQRFFASLFVNDQLLNGLAKVRDTHNGHTLAQFYHFIRRVLQLGYIDLDAALEKTPDYAQHFVITEYAVITSTPDNRADALADVLRRTRRDLAAEVWFLVSLVKRGHAGEALALAEKSDRAEDVLPYVRRAWLSTDPDAARQTITPETMAGDPVGEFLAQPDPDARIRYLQENSESVLKAVWYGDELQKEKLGLGQAMWKGFAETMWRGASSSPVLDFVLRTPVYNVVLNDVINDRTVWFAEFVRIQGYGEYQYQEVDPLLLEALYHWHTRDPDAVRTLLSKMWNQITPFDQIIYSHWLREAILERCRTILSADSDVLVNEFLPWVRTTLIEKTHRWEHGKTMVTYTLKNDAFLNFGTLSARAIDKFSAEQRDHILVNVLQQFKPDSSFEAETAALAGWLYNSDKELLDLQPPIPLDPRVEEGWQLGVVNHAFHKLFQASRITGIVEAKGTPI